ncbi:MAG TPA: hypothetical protein VMB50_20895 [Myxococcales bacterium]|nr:hypothetical protein [Myxococcales bacterium]
MRRLSLLAGALLAVFSIRALALPLTWGGSQTILLDGGVRTSDVVTLSANGLNPTQFVVTCPVYAPVPGNGNGTVQLLGSIDGKYWAVITSTSTTFQALDGGLDAGVAITVTANAWPMMKVQLSVTNSDAGVLGACQVNPAGNGF